MALSTYPIVRAYGGGGFNLFKLRMLCFQVVLSGAFK